MVLVTVLTLGACSDDTAGPGKAFELAFAVSPSSMGSGETMNPPISVAIRDENGNTVYDWTDPVTLNLVGGASGPNLLGTTTQAPLAGLAIFPDLAVSRSFTGLRLRASSGNLGEVESGPFDVYGLFHAQRISAGERHTCALEADGTAYCFGANSMGQLGIGDVLDRHMPTRVQTPVKFATVTANGEHTCGLSMNGEAYCWGSNGRGELGDGSSENSSLPRKVPLPGPVASVDAGYWHACALLQSGEAYCWGDNWGGALGIGVAEGYHRTPVKVGGDHEWTTIETGYLQSCGLTAEGKAYCWGPNVYGANGDGTRSEPRPSPTPVVGGHTFRELIAGGGPCHGETCGITIDGTVLCWGKNYQRHSSPTTDISWTVPTAIQGDPGWVDVFIGANLVCGHTAGGELYCIGDPLYGIMAYAEEPALMVPELSVATITQGETHACVLTLDGEAYCWGGNHYGQLGSGGKALGWSSPKAVWDPPGGS